MSHRDFSTQLENFRREAELIAQLVYGDFAVNQAALESDAVFAGLNNTPRFWNLWSYAAQSTSYIAIGRVFDLKSKYTIEALLDSLERNLSEFQLAGLKARKDPSNSNPSWLHDYLEQAYFPTTTDVKRLRKMVARRRVIYERMIKPARHKYYAHREKHSEEDVRQLFQGGTVDELWLLATFLVQFYDQLFQLYANGRRPVFPRIPHSIRSLYSKPSGGNGQHHKLIEEIKLLMRQVAVVTPISSR